MRKIFLIYAATLLMGAGLAACSSDDNSGDNTQDQEASLPTPTGNNKYLTKYEVINEDSSVLVAKYTFSGNGLLLADTTYAPFLTTYYLSQTRKFTYGDKGLSEIAHKQYLVDGTIDNTSDENNYTTTYTYSGNTISGKDSYQLKFTYVYYMENGKIMKLEEVGDTDVEEYSYAGNDRTGAKYFDDSEPKGTQVNVFEDKKNPFYNNFFAFRYEALGEHNVKTCTVTYPDGEVDVRFNVEYISYNSQGYPTEYKDKSAEKTYTYQYVGW
jgi:hypothetical protein